MPSEPQPLPAVHEAYLPREHALHRPRHGRRQLTALVAALLFFTTPTLLWVFGVRPGEIENHKLAGFPSLSGGFDFFTDLPAWATDQLSFRAGAIEAADGISRSLFGEDAPLDQGPAASAGPIPAPPLQQPGAPNAGPEPSLPGSNQAGYRKVVQGLDGWLYYGYDAEGKCTPTQDLDTTLKKINELREAVEASGRKFEFVVAPDKSTMVPQFLPGSYPGKECSQAAAPNDWYKMTTTGHSLDLRPALAASAARVGHPIYAPNDTHWRDEGGLVLTRALAEAVQPGSTGTWTSAPAGQYDALADLPLLLGKSGVKTNTQYSLRPDGVTDRTTGFIGTIDQPVPRRSAPLVGTVNQPTLIYGDSFSMASSRYLDAAFTNLTYLAYSTDKTPQAGAVEQFVNSRVVVLEAVERNVAGGLVPFTDDGFIAAVKAALAAHPVR
ncbi:alginate O-acetyltransferase AlgX-related protein [Amycolatopsis sp. PS_44_ISF1]|uniref:alginate O-acetyltransferase AlgX-related protein n=1 Tax=Amycolatopsis sp. PS_44_ISF1 TaxID=2974917 RepID=UPI0028DF59D1|nr:hypothetical protein [Amycolatopsis sp. PS_44_ISF1]MDT8910993.1 hypothetical protein [Amycolatopsis sp. PS_44_ISF1]